MSVREYVGARYVPIIMGEWDKTRTYEPLMVVTHQGNSYTSRQYVPTGIDIANESYWALSANYNAQVEQYRQEVTQYKASMDNTIVPAVNKNTEGIEKLEKAVNKNTEGIEKLDKAVNKNTEGIEKLEKLATYHFDTLKDLTSESIEIGSICFVSGRLTKNIGGGFYRIVSGETANGYDKVQCASGNVAVFIPIGFVMPEQLEQESTVDYAPLIKYAIDYANANSIDMCAFGTYSTSTPIVFEYGTDRINVRVDGNIVYDGTDYAIKIKNTKSRYYFRSITATNGSGIAFDQRDNPYDYNVANHYLEFGEIIAKNNGVGFIAANHGVLDIDVQCDILIRAANCYYSSAGNSGISATPSYASEFHIHGGRLYGSSYAINIEVGSGYECTGHSYCDFSAEGSSKLINLDAGTGSISTVHMENVRIAEIGSDGMIKATGNVRECDFYFNHLFMLPWFENNMTTDISRGCYVHAPINMSGGSYTGFNCAYFSGNGLLMFSDMQIMHESGISEGYQWNANGTKVPLSMIRGKGTFDVSQFPNFTNNGYPLYIFNTRTIKITNGTDTIFDGTTNDEGMYALIRTDVSIRVLKMA